ncbi:MAG: hypothetical protein AAGD25_04100 [Cyanobacteria bacterium P01_F01_bin.150]
MPQKTPPLTHTNDSLSTPSSQALNEGETSVTMSSDFGPSSLHITGSVDQVIAHSSSSRLDDTDDGISTSSSVLDSQSLLSKTEASAEELMDSVFEDVDYMLDKGVSLVPASATQSSPQKQNGLVHQTEAIASTQANSNSLKNQDDTPQLASTAESLSDRLDSAVSPSSTDQAWGRALKITMPIFGACVFLGVALAAGLVIHSPSSPWNRGAIADAGGTNPSDGSDAEFAGYMQRALDTIARSETSVSALANGSDNNANGSGSDSNGPVATNPSFRSSGVPQRVYIPVYQPPSPSGSTLPSVPVQSSLDSGPESVSSTLLPTPPEPVAFSPSTASSSTVAPTALPAPVSAPAPTPAPLASPPVLSELSHDHVLVGLLQLGDRSVAMFDFSEGTHRVKVGEQIGDSGWSLVSVSQNEAVIRRNGDVRSIYIGQSF